MGVGCYGVSAIRAIAGEPRSLAGEELLGASGVDVVFSGTARCPDDALAHFDCGFVMPYRAGIEVAGEDGVIVVPSPWHPTDPLIELHRGDGVERIEVPARRQLPARARERRRRGQRGGAPAARRHDAGAGAGHRLRPCSAGLVTYGAAAERYDGMPYRRCGRSGLKLPAISLGLWQNFGGERPLENGRAIVRRAFDLGITHFDLANNYGPPSGSAEETFGALMRKDFRRTATS